MAIQFKGLNDMRCPVCLLEWNKLAMQAVGIKVCPQCKTSIPALEIANDGYIKANWQDLRVLAIYAKRWAQVFNLKKQGDRDALQALDNILVNIQRFKPKNAIDLVPPHDDVIIGVIERHENPPMVQIVKEVTDHKAGKDSNGNITSPYFYKG